MDVLPLLIDAGEAIEFARSNRITTDAMMALIVATISRDGYSNSEIRAALDIGPVYRVTHLKRVGLALSEDEMELWHQNPSRITFGHVRAIWKFPREDREKMLRDLLLVQTPVSEFERIARGEVEDVDCDVNRYATLMGEVLGRGVRIKYDKSKKVGSITLDFFTLDDLEDLSMKLGYRPEEF